MVAFVGLYLLVAQIHQEQLLYTLSRRSVDLLQGTIETLRPAMEHRSAAEFEEVLERLVRAHDLESLHIYDTDGELSAGNSPSEDFSEPVRELLSSGDEELIWLHNEAGDRLVNHNLLTVRNGPDCQSCHGDVEILGVASINVDLTDQMVVLRSGLQYTMLTVFVIWGVLVFVTNVLVKRSIQRSRASLEADLRAAEAGEPAPADKDKLVLDPVASELHKSLRQFLGRQRERQAEVASRMEQTDKLASMGRLAAGLAHEIRNPLAGIAGAIEILRDECPDDPTKHVYAQMLADLTRINTAIESLLNLARPSSPNLATTDVGQLLDDALQLLRPMLQRRGISVRLEVAAGLPEFLLDPDRIRQVVVNLVRNSAQAIDRDGQIVVRCTTFPGGDGVIIAVEDDGPGIPADVIGRVFDPFFSTKLSGTGLGLSVATSLVEQHGGRLEVKSDPGEGTTFYVLLPGPGDRGGPDSSELPDPTGD